MFLVGFCISDFYESCVRELLSPLVIDPDGHQIMFVVRQQEAFAEILPVQEVT